MRAGPGRGALVGVVAGALLTVALVLVPAALRGDYYEITDPLVFLGVPFVVFGAGLGALLGLRGRPVARGGPGAGGLVGPRPAAPVTGFVVVAVLAMAFALWFLLWATGFVAVAPFGLG